MNIRRFSTTSFRNLQDSLIEPHERFNVIEGDNAQGKTNLLEAIHMLSALRSFRARRNEEVIRWGEKSARVAAVVEAADGGREVSLDVAPGLKTISVDGKRMRRLEDCFGHLTAVLFCPEDLALTRGGPSERRRFLDRAVANIDRGHVRRARDYETALRNRNAALRDQRDAAGETVLDVYDCAVAAMGAGVLEARHRFLLSYLNELTDIVKEVTSGAFDISVSYECSAGDVAGLTASEMEARLLGLLRARRAQDSRRGATSVGPHADDLSVAVDGRPAQAHASEGQHRTAVLCLKVAEIRHVSRRLGFYPVLLLDDVSSELDSRRNAVLMEYLRSQGGQVFITTTERSHIRVGDEVRGFRMVRGRIEQGA